MADVFVTSRTGISRAIEAAGNQVELSRLIWKVFAVHIWQSRISDWERSGAVPTREKALMVSRVTGVPVEDLLRQEKRKRRPSKKPEKAS